jgi:hypothetical protein
MSPVVVDAAVPSPPFSAGELAAMRATVSAALPDSCTIGARGEPTFDTTTGTYTEGAVVAVYTGPCRVRVSGMRGDLVVQAGDEPVTLRTYDATLPWDATGVAVDHILTVTASADPELVGRSMRVRDVQYGSWDLGRRLTLEDDLG